MLMKEKIGKYLNDSFNDSVVAALTERFPGIKFETDFNLLEMRKVTTWDKKVPAETCREIQAFLVGFEGGYIRAMNVVAGFNGKVRE